MKNNHISKIVYGMVCLMIIWGTSYFAKAPKRDVATVGLVSAMNCEQLLNLFMHERRFRGQFAEEFAADQAKHWSKHGKLAFHKKLMRLLTFRERRLELYTWINRNAEPIYFYDPDKGLPYIKKFIEFKNGDIDAAADFVEESMTAIDGWLAHYVNYEKEVNDLIDEEVVSEFWEKVLKKDRARVRDGYAAEHDITSIRNGQVITIKEVFDDIHELNAAIRGFADRKKELRKVEIPNREMEQALLKKRLTYLKRELHEFMLNNPSKAYDVKELYDRTAALLRDRRYFPKRESLYDVQTREIKAEWKDMFGSVKKKLEEFQNNELIQSLSEESREELGVNAVGRFKKTLVGTKYFAIATFLTGTTFSVTKLVSVAIKFFETDKKKRNACYEQYTTDPKKVGAFNRCIYDYMVEKFPHLAELSRRDSSLRPFNLEKTEISALMKAEIEAEYQIIEEELGRYITRLEIEKRDQQAVSEAVSGYVERARESLNKEDFE